jgi:hypothetical protein
MSSFNDTGYGTITLTAAVAQYLRVSAAGAVAVLATPPYGTARVSGAIGDVIGVVYANKQGSAEYVASKAIAAGVKVYTTTAGKVTDTFATGGFCLGISRTAAAADGDILEVVQMPSMTTGA